MRRESARPQPARDPYADWYWRTWPNHALADPDAKRKQKAVLELIESTAGAMLAVGVLAVILSKKNDTGEVIKASGEAFGKILDVAASQASDIGSVTKLVT